MTATDTDLDALVGTTVGGRYRIDALLGRGGMGAVFQATNTAIGKRVALKFLYREAARDLDAVTRFQREAESASAVESAHIVQIFDSGTTDDGLPFLVMEHLRGEDLRARLQREGRLPLGEVVHIAGQVARGLRGAHDAGIVHRDLKPDNIFLCDRDDDPMFAKIVDFGISKVANRGATADTLTHKGVVLGTAFYMSPEQAKAERDIDGRTDLFSLGAIMYEALAGRPPHEGNAYEAVLIDICTREVDDVRTHAPDVPEAVAQVLSRALARDREARFADACQMYDALAAAAPGMLRPGPLSGSGQRLLGTPRSGEGAIQTSDRPRPPSDPGAVAAAGQRPFRTEEGTAVGPAVSRASGRQLRRNVVVALIAGLGAFALTVALMATRQPPKPAAPTHASPGPAVQASQAPAARASAPEITPSASAASAEAPEPSARIADKPGAARRPARAASQKTPTGSTQPTKRATGVAKGLRLVTEP